MKRERGLEMFRELREMSARLRERLIDGLRVRLIERLRYAESETERARDAES